MSLFEKYKKYISQLESVEPVGENSKVLFIDGLNTFIRAHAATPTMNDDGDHAGGVTGFLKSIGAFIRMEKPSRVVCVFDGKGGSQRRKKIYPEYKEHRKTKIRLNRTFNFLDVDQERESMKWQIFLLLQLLGNLPVTIISQDFVEADDVIAYLAKYVEEEKQGKSIILSTDKDFLQLVNDSISVWNPVKKKMYTAPVVLEEYGIHPQNFMMYRAITGDDSDNVDGVRGFGEKTLLKFFPEFASDVPVTTEKLIEAAAKFEKSKTCKLLTESKDKIERNIELMNLLEVQMGVSTKGNVITQFDKEIPHLNKLGLTKLLISSKLINAITNDLDKWIMTTFVPLTRYTKH